LNATRVHQDELQALREDMLKSDRAHQDELRTLQEKHNLKIEGYETRIFSLIDEKASQKKTPATPKPSTTRGSKKGAIAESPAEPPPSETQT